MEKKGEKNKKVQEELRETYYFRKTNKKIKFKDSELESSKHEENLNNSDRVKEYLSLKTLGFNRNISNENDYESEQELDSEEGSLEDEAELI